MSLATAPPVPEPGLIQAVHEHLPGLTLESEIGRGTHATVYRAIDVHDGGVETWTQSQRPRPFGDRYAVKCASGERANGSP